MPAIAPLATPELASMLDTAEQSQQASFLGTLARTADKGKLALAQAMEVKRASPEEIWRNTGWFRGADTKWRFEVPDTGSKFKFNPSSKTYRPYFQQGETFPMSEVLEHPELFAGHPELGQIRFSAKTMPQGTRASFTPPHGPIEMADKTSLQEKLKDMMHELQHAIQYREGFARGGNTWMDLSQQAKQAGPLPMPVAADASRIFGPITEAAYQRYLNNRQFENFLKKEQYLRQAGEVESRNVEKRLLMSPQQLRETPPWATQSIPNEYQFVNFRDPWEQNPASFLDTSLLRTRY